MEEVLTCLIVSLASFIGLQLRLNGCEAFPDDMKKIFKVFGLRFGRHGTS